MEIRLSNDYIVEKYLKMAIENPETPFEYGATTIINLKVFYDFIVDRVEAETINFEEYLKDLISRSGHHRHYELSPYETKTGEPETIYFEVTEDYDQENDQLSNHKIIF